MSHGEGGGGGRKVKKGVTYYLDGPNHNHLEINILALPKMKKNIYFVSTFFRECKRKRKKGTSEI